ncbi:hypothetical protein [Maricaulis maris]|uniref:Porin domain-containing protein n=1 Tax=Maricaulis maris TaxID=74318 RepID=A0A495D4C0_9PROT|nr:hypothetical protein [Maricaulis maris]RKQ96721.1 hypothetical protein C7435_2055 [Maricaulis maris]
MIRTVSAILVAALSGTLAGPPASGQGAGSAAANFSDNLFAEDVHSLDWRADLGLVLLAGDTPRDGAEWLADIQFGLDFESFTDGGRRWGLVLTGHAERDLYIDVQGGRVGACPAAIGDCATVGPAGAPLTPVAPDSGLYSAGPASGNRVRAVLSEAYAFADTGWGEIRFGYGDGAARLDPVGGPAAARLIRADGGHLLAASRQAIRTETPFSGQDPKLVFRSIALGQETTVGTLRAAVSFTPEASQCGIDYCPRRTLPGGQVGAINTGIAELAVNWDIRRGEHQWAISASASHAGGADGAPGFDPVSGLDAGLSWRWRDWRAGGRWRRSNNGVSGDGDYEALSASVGWEQGDWLTTLEYAAYSDDFVHSDGSAWQAATSRLVGDHGLVALGVQAARRTEPDVEIGGRVQREIDGTTAFIELGWRY